MRDKSSLLSLFIALSAVLTESCKVLNVASDVLGSLQFSQIPLDDHSTALLQEANGYDSGRPSYSADAEGNKIYLYHLITEGSSQGRWIINDVLGNKDQAISYITSWAISPHLTESVNDNEATKYWMVTDSEGNWVPDYSALFSCSEEDNIIYFESSNIQPAIAGFYIERVISAENSSQYPVFSQVSTSLSETINYFFKLNKDMWMIGTQYGVDAGVAYVDDGATLPHLINNLEWKFVDANANSSWTTDVTDIYHPTRHGEFDPTAREFADIYTTVRFAHSIKFIPDGQNYLTLRNNIPIPRIGLGTGGLFPEEAEQIISSSFELGYRFLDLAREYNNEHLIPKILAQSSADDRMPSRNDLFIQSKVWPTELGFVPTLNSLFRSLDSLETLYMDAYLLHWPECDSSVDWMHCETTSDPDGTWQDSWNLLEKAYAEGLVNSIGVSNFNVAQLDELAEFASVLPHIVQNFAEPGNLDLDVRDWCVRNQVVYQPYASGRNIKSLSDELRLSIRSLSKKYNVSDYTIVQEFFAQTGAVIIPRSANADHLQENLVSHTWELTEEELRSLGWDWDSDASDTPELNEEAEAEEVPVGDL